MKLTDNDIAAKILDYLNHRISIKELVDWCEIMLLSDDIFFENTDTSMEILTKIGLANVEYFSINWEEWLYMIAKLNYKIRVDYIHLAA